MKFAIVAIATMFVFTLATTFLVSELMWLPSWFAFPMANFTFNLILHRKEKFILLVMLLGVAMASTGFGAFLWLAIIQEMKVVHTHREIATIFFASLSNVFASAALGVVLAQCQKLRSAEETQV